MQKKRPKNLKTKKRRIKQKEFKLTPKQRRRNRIIAIFALSLLILFFISRCSKSDNIKDNQIEKNSIQKIETKKDIAIKEQNSSITNDFKKPDISKKIETNNNSDNISMPINKEISKNLLMEKYRKSRTYKSALAVSEFFYSQKQYKESAKWAIVANNINNQEKNPWLLYIKSKVALKENKKAKKAIIEYLKNFKPKNSEHILKVLKNIKDREK